MVEGVALPDGAPRGGGRGAGEGFVLRSGVRSGLKREFAFALKAQAELSVSPVGRTRSGKIRRDSRFGEGVFAVVGGGTGKGSAAGGGKRKGSVLGGVGMIVVGEEDALESEQEVVAVDGELMGLGAVGGIDGVDEMRVDERVETEETRTVSEMSPVEVEKAIMVVKRETVLATGGEEAKIADVRRETVLESNAEEAKVADVHRETVLESNGEEAAIVDVQRETILKREIVLESNEEEATIVDVSQRMVLESNGQEVTLDAPQKTVLEINGEEKILGGELSLEVTGRGGCDASEVEKVADTDMGVGVSEALKESSIAEVCVAETADLIDQQDDQRPVCAPELSSTAITIKLGKHGKLEKPFARRFTRSLLKSPAEEPPPTGELSSTVTSSSSSDGSEGVRGGETNFSNGASGPLRTTPKKKMELKMSKKIALTKLPCNVKDLLATGLLDGLPVKYISSSKKREGALCGVIKNSGILCSCSSCEGTKVISAYQFELHAGSTKKHPSDYIYLENGKSIHDVLRACTSAPLDMLESTIQNAIGFGTNALVSFCQQCNESFQIQPARVGKLSSICDSCLVERLSPIHKSSSSMPHKNTKLPKSSLAPNSFDSSSKNISSHKKSGQGRVTTKDLWLHKLVFMNDTLPNGTEVAYYARGQRLLEGYIKGAGIFCSCCSSVVSPSQFESHAGYAKRRKPYLNIYTSNGVSLHELSVSLSKDKTFSARENDDLCRICTDGGNLLLCDLCPRAFHKECVGLSSLPQGDWYCPCCEAMHQRENYVAHNENAIAAGRVSGVDPIEQIFQRCIRIVQTPETDASSCVLCNCHDFSKSGFGARTVLLCDQCEKEFHIGCLKEHSIADLKELPQGKWFCCSDCSKTHDALQTFLLSGSQQLPDLLLENMKRKQMEKGLSSETDLDVRWRLLNGKMATPDCRLLLSKAISIFHETFDPIIDFSTGQDLIPAMVYGRDMRHQDFGGMYCALLTVNSSVVSAGILRVLGCETAELPLVATTMESQGLGYFQSLFSCIETLLESLKVKHLVLPATKEAEAIWIKKFGFGETTLKQLEEYTKGSRTMSFQGTPMLHKPLSASQATGEGEPM